MGGIAFVAQAVQCVLIVSVSCVPSPLGKRCTATAQPIRICEPRVLPSKTPETRTTLSTRAPIYDYYRRNSSLRDFSAPLGRPSI